MSGDYSRYGFDPNKDFNAVLLQQGRPLTDRDWNEEVIGVDRRMQAGTYDAMGQAVVPSSTPNAFAITFDASGQLQIGPGRMYVDGLLAENHGGGTPGWNPALAELHGVGPTPYSPQPYLPNPPPLPAAGAPAIAYLDVWQREVTQFEDRSILEPALGVDTTTRRQTVWQVKFLADMPDGTNCASDLSKNTAWSGLIAPSGGRLTSAAGSVPGQDDPCLIPPASGYTGLENQLYRVEIQSGGVLGTATFKWSRDNGSVMARVTQIIDLSNLMVDSVGKDDVLRFSDGDWIEITDDWLELAGLPGELHRIAVGGGVDDATRIITLEKPLSAGLFPTPLDASRHTRIRRWDQQGKVLDATGTLYVDLDTTGAGAITVPAGGRTLLLENGVLVTFSIDPAGGSFQLGDYWVFAARASDGTVETLNSAPPRGIHHHYAKLAVVTFPNTVGDCRTFWPPAGGGEDCACTACVTPASHSNGTYTLQKAVDDVSSVGGTVCLKPGSYTLAQPVTVTNPRSLHIVGQGPATILSPTAGAFVINGGNHIALSDFAIQGGGALTGTGDAAILSNAADDLTIERLVIELRAETAVAIGFASLPINAAVRQCEIQAPSGIVYLPPVQGATNTIASIASSASATTSTPAPSVATATNLTAALRTTTVLTAAPVSSAAAAASTSSAPARDIVAMATRNPVSAAAGAATAADQPVPPAGVPASMATSTTAAASVSPNATISLVVEANLFATQLSAVTIVGQGATAFTVRICRNRVGICSVWGLGLQSPPLANSSVDIEGNLLWVNSPAIIAGVNGLRIRNNDLVFTGATKGAQDGITVFSLYPGDLLGDCQIIGNRITGFGAAGAAVRSPANRVMIKQNQIAQTGAGIALEYAATSTRPSGMISVENNQLTDIATQALSSDAAPTTIATAIWAHNATAAHIAGNSVLRLGTNLPVAQSRVAVLVWGSDRAHVSGNEISDVGPAGTFTGPSTGVSIVEPFGGVEILDNLVRRYSAGATAPAADTGEWIPVIVLAALPNTIAQPAFMAASNLGNFTNALSIKADTVVTNITSLSRVAPAAFVSVPPPITTERVAIRGNQLEGFGSAPVALIAGPVDCVFTDNHCLLTTPQSQLRSSVDVILAANTVIAGNNRIVGGATSLDITVPKTTACSVLGNLTRGGISVDGNPLAEPWASLNVVGL